MYALASAANICATNFRWLHMNGLRHIPLLDFDLISGAMPRLAIEKRLSNEADGAEYGLLGNYGGTTSVQYLLGVMKRYVLPPGTALELLTRKRNLSESISDRAANLLDRIEAGRRSGDPVAGLMSKDAPDIFREDLTRFYDDVRGSALLDKLISRATPTEELLGEESFPNDRAVAALRAAYGFLQLMRPERSVNNFNDALNVALVERLYNARPHGSEIPVLVSQTRVVATLATVSERLRTDSRGELPSLINDATYLVVSENLVLRADDRYATAADEAEVLAEDANTLASRLRDLLRHCQKLAAEDRLRERDIAAELMPFDDWEELLFLQRRFEKHWGSMLAPARMVVQHDAPEYLNVLCNGHWRLRNRDVVEIEKSIRQLREEVEGREPQPEQAMWKIILNREAEPAVRAAFDYSEQIDEPVLLREANEGLPPRQYEASKFANDHDVVIAAIPRFVSGGALTLGTYRKKAVSPLRYVKLTWSHGIPARAVIEKVFDSVSAAGFDLTGATAVICTPNALAKHSVGTGNVAEEIIAAFDANRDSECLHVYASDVKFFVDTVPLDGLEFQVGLHMSEKSWKAFGPFAARLVSQTNGVELQEAQASIVLGDLAGFLGLSPKEEPSPHNNEQTRGTIGA
jgi:hypothetical protein